MDFETASDLFDDVDDDAFAGAIPGVDTDVEDDDDANSVVRATQKPMPTIGDDDSIAGKKINNHASCWIFLHYGDIEVIIISKYRHRPVSFM